MDVIIVFILMGVAVTLIGRAIDRIIEVRREAQWRRAMGPTR